MLDFLRRLGYTESMKTGKTSSRHAFILLLIVLTAMTGLTAADDAVSVSALPAPSYELKGIASWYTSDRADSLTANGETFNPTKMAAAHKELKFGTLVEVHNLNNGKKATVRINDRGPYVDGRIIDLTPEAARSIGMYESGIAPVELTIVYEPTVPESLYNRAGDTGWYKLQLGAYSNSQTAWGIYQKLLESNLKPTVEIIGGSMVRLSIRWVAAYQLDRTLATLSTLGFAETDILKKGEYSPFEE